MNVRTICLAILHEGEASGYEIRKRSTQSDFAFFVEASYGSIYPALARLEEEELVESRVEQQEGRPAKKIYAITEAGHAAFSKELLEPLAPDTFRSEFLLFARFARLIPAETVAQRVDEQIAHYTAEISWLSELRQSEMCSDDEWILRFGMAAHTAARDFLKANRNQLVALARTNYDGQAAE